MLQNSTIKGLDIVDQISKLNEGFKFGKQHCHSYPIDLEKERCKTLGELIHYGLCGPMDTQSIRRSFYYVLFKDDCT
jgi:hypothetical protein